MTDQEAFNYYAKKSPTGYRLGKLIPFSYPVRRIRLALLVNKQPDGSLVKVYTVLMRSIQAGFQSTEDLFEFLGLSRTDEFILRELYSLREKEYINIVSGKWVLTERGELFLKENSIFRVEEEEDADFLIDGISGELLSAKENGTEREPLKNKLPSELNFPEKSPDLLENKFEALSEIYKKENESKSFLISFLPDEIKRDFKEWFNLYLLEYISDQHPNQETKLEVRYISNKKENRILTTKFNGEYRSFVDKLSEFDKTESVPISVVTDKHTV
ncbi:MAG: hypothetical protein LCH54_13995 [Bacteroidetes bacterium]|nr:hypothetical protein [Bacteroidota bacterium]